MTDPAALIADECDSIKDMLLQKNASYGNSALDPVRVFSRTDTVEQLKVRIDDKLSRLSRRTAEHTFGDEEDTVLDLIGYLVLLRVAERVHAEESAAELELVAQKLQRIEDKPYAHETETTEERSG